MKRQILCLALVINLWACPVLGREIGWPAARADISHPKAALKKDTLQFPSIDEEKKERRILQAILARPEFRYDQMKVDPVRLPARYTAWIHDLLKKIAHLMARLFSRGSTSIRRKFDYPWLFSRYILMAKSSDADRSSPLRGIAWLLGQTGGCLDLRGANQGCLSQPLPGLAARVSSIELY